MIWQEHGILGALKTTLVEASGLFGRLAYAVVIVNRITLSPYFLIHGVVSRDE
jgi:hypothetical protein